ncbi:hypothetical protein L0244_39315, partial [bacterium]|nr:hypothetical protein [bacterium]
IIGKTIGGTIYGVHEFKGKGFKGKIIQMRHENGTAFGFPLCASVRYGLANFLGIEDSALTLEGISGLHMDVKGLGKGTTKDGKRPKNMLEVFITKNDK